MRWEIVNSISLLKDKSATNSSVIGLEKMFEGVRRNNKNNNKQRVFVLSDRGSSSSSSISCRECDPRAFILERVCNNGNTKWNYIYNLVRFLDFHSQFVMSRRT